MFKHYLERIDNVELWPIISLIIFFLFFTGLLIYIFKIDKKFVEKMERMPFEGGDNVDNSKPLNDF